MGPIAAFDKSFLQSLSVDESVWFDHFFVANVCPIFYIEALADLSKQPRAGKSSGDEVAIIASKFPEMHGAPNVHHATLCEANLLGNDVPMTGQILVAGGRPANVSGKTGVVFDTSPEVDAFLRWQNGQFTALEKLHARQWRERIRAMDLRIISRALMEIGISGRGAKSLSEVATVANAFLEDPTRSKDQVVLSLLLQAIPMSPRSEILARWRRTGSQPLLEFAPYAAFVLRIDLFFYLSLSASLISSDRPSNRLDIAYLYYLPFCMTFVSSDKLHSRCAPLFLRSDQSYVWGPQLKEALADTDSHFKGLPEEAKAAGILSFADRPPDVGSNLLVQIWDRHLVSNWRDLHDRPPPIGDADAAKIRQQITEIADAAARPDAGGTKVPTNPDTLIFKRRVHGMKGSWYQMPKHLRDRDQQ